MRRLKDFFWIPFLLLYSQLLTGRVVGTPRETATMLISDSAPGRRLPSVLAAGTVRRKNMQNIYLSKIFCDISYNINAFGIFYTLKI